MFSLSKENIDTNRGKNMFINAYNELKQYLSNKELPEMHFCYFDRQNLTDNHVSKQKVESSKIFQCFKDCHSWRIDDKREFARIMNNDITVPKSYLKFDEYLKEKHKYPDDKVWFVKSRGSTSGKGVYCKYNHELATSPGERYIIQEEIPNIDLWNNRKYVIRSYVLIWNKKAYFHKKAMAFIHGEDYVSNTSHEIQVSHAGYWSENGRVKVKPLCKINELANKPRNFHNKLLELLFNVSKTICHKFKDMVDASEENTYIILGTDFLVTKKNRDYNLKIVEVNRYPNISHTQEVNREVNERMIRDTMVLFYQINHPLGHDYVEIPFT